MESHSVSIQGDGKELVSAGTPGRHDTMGPQQRSPGPGEPERFLYPDPSSILILRPAAIGDTLLTFPALLALRRRFSSSRLAVIGNRTALQLGLAASIIDEGEAFGADWISDLFDDCPPPSLRARLERFGLGIVWMHDVAAATDLARRLERAGLRQAIPLVSFPEAGQPIHLADHLLASLAPLGIPSVRPLVALGAAFARVTSPLTAGSAARTEPIPALSVAGQPLAVLHPGAGGRRKRWASDGFAAIADRLAARGYAVALTCGPADEDAVLAVQRAVRCARPLTLAGRSLEELARILADASLFVGNDSGITHLAALLGVPTVAIFGPFDPIYWAPIGPRVSVVDAGFGCCHRADPRDGCRTCDGLERLSIETVWAALQPFLAGSDARQPGETTALPASGASPLDL